MYIAKKDVKDAAGSLQVCAGQKAGSEEAIHAIYDVYQQDETEAVLLADADNAFNAPQYLHHLPSNNNIYRKLLHETSQIICCRES